MKKLSLFVCLIMFGCKGGEQTPRWYTSEQVTQGKVVYEQHCISCHDKDARGTYNWKIKGEDGFYPPPPLNGTAHAWHHSKAALLEVITEGGVPLGGKMPAFKEKLNEAEKEAVIAYFQSFWPEHIYRKWWERQEQGKVPFEKEHQH